MLAYARKHVLVHAFASASQDVLETARVLFHVTNGARIPWANGLVTDDALRASLHQAVDLLFKGVGERGA